MIKIKENAILYLVILMFFGLSLFKSINLRNCQINFRKVQQELILQKNKVLNYNERSRLKLYMDSEKLKQVVLLSPEGDSIPLNEILLTPKLIFRFSDQFCEPCIESALSSLRLLGDKIGYDKILVISDSKNTRLLKILINNYKILSPCFSFSGQFNFEIEDKEVPDKKPYYMVLDVNNTVSFPFFAEENDHLNSIYLGRIEKLFSDMQ